MPTIDDIIIKKKSESEFFNEYRDAREIGELIFQSFKTKFVEGKGFPLSEEEKKYGVISNAMALSTLLEIEDMGVDISSFDEEFKFLLKDVFSATCTGRVHQRVSLKFLPTPYIPYSEEKNKCIDSYVETASKIMIIMIDLMNYANKHDYRGTDFRSPIQIGSDTIRSFSELAKLAEKVLVGSMTFLSKAALHVKTADVKTREIGGELVERDGLPTEVCYRGWTFCKPNDNDDSFDTSIYFTYHGTNAYVSLYNAMPRIIDRIVIGKDVLIQSSSDEERELQKRNEEFVIQNKEAIDELRIITNASGRYIERLLAEKGVDLAFDFVKNDFSGISSSSVISIQDNNAVINTLFILAIYLNSGIDEDYEFAGENRIDAFFNQLQFAISNIRKIYSVLKVEKKQDIVDSYSLYSALLSEKYSSSYKDFIPVLRKGCRNVAVYDLIPLLCNTYSLVFDYLIRYPQIEMVNNLELIMENCSDKDEWLWGDANGFSVNNHLYYVVALENFYRYYEEYEAPLSGNQEKYNKIVEERKHEYEERLEEERQKTSEFQKKCEELELELKNKKSALDAEVERISQNYFDGVIEKRIDTYLEEMLAKAMDYYLQTRNKRYTPAQIEAALQSDPKLFNAFALFGSIRFDDDLVGDLESYDEGYEKYSEKKAEHIRKSISKKIHDSI